jgi:hypothetical protein
MRPRSTFALVLIALVTALVALVYARHALRVNGALELIQTSVADFSPELLADRSPIVIEEQLVDPEAAARRLLRHSYLLAVVRAATFPPRVSTPVRAALAAVVAGAEGEELTLFHPTNGADTTVLLRKDQVVLVPARWSIEPAIGPCRVLLFKDLFTPLYHCGPKR